MSEPAAEKKKGGKLPIIIGLVVVLAAGGYFGLNKGGKKDVKKEPEAPKLAAIMDLGEFTVNLKGGSNFLRAKIAVHTDATIDAAHGAESYAAPLQDVIITVLSDYTMEQVLSPSGKNELRRRLAYEMNHRMHLVHPHEGEEEATEEETKEGDKEGEGKDTKADEHGDSHGGGHGSGKPWLEEPKFPELDSDKGPILKIYLTDFAMQ
ncbi:MAG: flagellar basal body-associated FliL family protein [Fimbriimonadaceae bacterium]|nr:flagellar basal body-associated FliL family protein [Fimbriimonadaceae bacterium]